MSHLMTPDKQLCCLPLRELHVVNDHDNITS